jgi:NhaA family Na+:H+ antiporter
MSTVPSPPRLFGAVARPIQAFLHTEAAGGVLLLGFAVVALAWANVWPGSYDDVFDYPLRIGAGLVTAQFSLRELINDGLMAIFFFVVGMEIKRELAIGELNSLARASLPAIAAVGGMVVPAGIFLLFNPTGVASSGWGIPMATDIAFCVGILTLLKRRVPHALIVFVTALAIFDDIGGILVIAFFYGHGLSVPWLLAAVATTVVLWAMNRAYVINGLAYGLLGVALWYALHGAGIHATIAGVILGLMIPVRPQRRSSEVLEELSVHVNGLAHRPCDEELGAAEILAIEEKLEDLQGPLHRFVHLLHPFVAFLIMPVFALANSGVSLEGAGLASFTAPVALGTALGLFVGKQLGIFGLTLAAVRLGVSPMPGAASPTKLFGVSVIAGIGFTVALFIAGLAYPGNPELLDQAKLGILVGSALAGIAGFTILRLTRPVHGG